MVLALPQQPTISVGDTETAAVNYTDHLDSGELLTGTPTAVEQTTSDLTLASVAVSTATYVEAQSGDTVAIGNAVQFSVSGGTASNSPYLVRVTCATDATPARTFVRDVSITWA